MDYFNVVEMLRQAGMPPLAADRQTSTQWDGSPWPLLIAGGPGVTMNPEPMAPFFDAILIGEAEEAAPEFIELCRDGLDDRDELLRMLDRRRVGTSPVFARPTASTWTSARSSVFGCAIWPPTTHLARSTRPTPNSATCI